MGVLIIVESEFHNSAAPSLPYPLQLGFNDLAESDDTVQGFDGVWKLAYVVFMQTKLWLYRLVSMNTTCTSFLTVSKSCIVSPIHQTDIDLN